ncbi:Two-component transcriptional response regulator, LuxR family [hydrothermal vent metagenome]|uniref:Two-component transcriptional response regulator, LuxR family n=2 Tax=hydrothermal vent metagenome TaxID=652676 RepID=A0A3B0UYG5_9ZZZZ
MSDSIRILIADDHPLFREGVAQSLANEPDFVVVGQAGSGEEAFTMAGDLLPDVLLLDVAMPGDGGIVTASKVTAAWPIVRIMMLTVSENQDDLMAALKVGARGYVLKGVTARDLTKGVRLVASGDVYISPALAGSILFELTAVKQEEEDPLTTLSERERDILILVSEGLTNREVGERLHLAEKTIKHYMTNVLQKLHVRSRVEAALLAQKHGLSR